MFHHSLEPSQNPPPPEVGELWSGRASLFSFQPSGIINTLKELKPHEKRSIHVEVTLVDISLLKCGGKSGISKWYLLRHDPSHAFPPPFAPSGQDWFFRTLKKKLWEFKIRTIIRRKWKIRRKKSWQFSRKLLITQSITQFHLLLENFLFHIEFSISQNCNYIFLFFYHRVQKSIL